MALVGLGRPEEALRCYDRATKLKPDYASAWSNKAGVLVGLDRSRDALKCYERVTELKPEDAGAWVGKGAALGMLSRFEEALECYERAVKLKPKDSGAWVGKGAALGGMRRFQEALECYDRAIKLRPEYAEAWSGKVEVLVGLGRFQDALDGSNRALELKPDDAMTWASKGLALANLERYEEAKSALEYSKRLGSPLAGQLLEKLRNQLLGVNVRGTTLTPERQAKLEAKERQEKLAVTHEASANFEEARRCLKAVIKIATELYGEDDWRVTDARLDLKDLNQRSRMSSENREALEEAQRLNEQANALWREKPNEALLRAQEAMEIRGRILAKENRDYVESLSSVARLHKLMEEFPRAEDLYQEALKVREKILGENHPDYVESLKNLAGLYYVMGESDKADSLREKASKITIPSEEP